MGCILFRNLCRTQGRSSLHLFVLALSIAACAGDEPAAPFFDGLTLDYLREHDDTVRTVSYRLSATSENTYRFSEEIAPKQPNDDLLAMILDSRGRVESSGFFFMAGPKYSPAWIPTGRLSVGDTFNMRKTIKKEDLWKSWEVFVVEDNHTKDIDYYDLRTGFRVGGLSRPGNTIVLDVLVSTNAAFLVREIGETDPF